LPCMAIPCDFSAKDAELKKVRKRMSVKKCLRFIISLYQLNKVF